jgi:hypothetical protein
MKDSVGADGCGRAICAAQAAVKITGSQESEQIKSGPLRGQSEQIKSGPLRGLLAPEPAGDSGEKLHE